MTEQETLEDLVKTNIMNLLQWVGIDETEFGRLTPFQKALKQLAEKYGVSEMTMYRIKSGENWAKVK